MKWLRFVRVQIKQSDNRSYAMVTSWVLGFCVSHNLGLDQRLLQQLNRHLNESAKTENKFQKKLK